MSDTVRTPKGKEVPRYLLNAYVDALKEALLLRRRRYRPNLRATDKHDHILEGVAGVLIDNDCDPFRYVNYVFDLFISKHDDVYPNMLASSWAINKFLEDLPNFEHQVELRVRLMADHVKSRLDRGESLEAIMADQHSPLTALFKFALAMSLNRSDVAEQFKAAAKDQLFFEPLYKKFLGQWLPEEFVNG